MFEGWACVTGEVVREALSQCLGEMPCCRGGVSLYVLSLYVWAGEAVTKSLDLDAIRNLFSHDVCAIHSAIYRTCSIKNNLI